jgi:AcrR family transcriptional regulator
MMSSGPRRSAAEASRNQRERLFGALVATCAERGYEATRVSDLVSLSGVSRRDFYRHFEGKADCFAATMEALLGLGEEAAMERLGAGGSGLETLIGICAAQPAAARLCLLESHVAGARAVALMDGAVAEAEAVLEQALVAPEGPGRMPRGAVAAILGGVREVVEGRLLAGREGELGALAPALREWALGYRAPSAPLPLPRPQPGAAARYLPGDPAERMIAALAAEATERGYQAVTVEQIVARAGVSLSTFYQHFDGRQDLFSAALEAGQARLVGAALPSFRRARDWPAAVRSAFEAMFAFFATEPAYARLALVEVYAAGGAALERRERMLVGLHRFVEPGFELRPELPPVVVEAIAGATYALAAAEVRRSGSAGLPALAPLATYLTLAPFLGAEAAAGAARGRR